tara:strand:+ start:397 stop:672 length:276 start_codon:yes stop_codon:yes gene_type:complete
MILIYDNAGILAKVHPAPKFLDKLTGTLEEKMIHLADKVLPTGTSYEIANNSDFTDRTFRNAWEYVAGANAKSSADLTPEDLAKYNMKGNK